MREWIDDHGMKHTLVEKDGNAVETIDPGNKVICDDCSGDYTERPDSGGILFQSKALCPECAPKWLASAQRYGEERFIRGRCPAGKSFADWVREDCR